MATTNTQNEATQTTLRMATGALLETTTAVAVEITTGFKPRYVRVVNETAGHFEEWNDNMADAEALKTTEDAGTVNVAMITSNGITPSATGFTIGLDTDINVVNEQISWIAFG